MNQLHLYTLLFIIKNNGDVRRLKREGLEYLEIAELTNEVISNQFAKYKDNSIVLTTKGKSKLIELQKTLKKTNKKNWIEKELKSIIPKIDKNFIFLPNQNDLDF